MAKEKDEFWAGGSWEQPTSRYGIPDTPNYQLRHQVKLSQSIRRWKRRGRNVLSRMIGILVAGGILAGILIIAVSHPASPFYIQSTIPWTGSGGGVSGNSGSYDDFSGTVTEDTSDYMDNPTLEQADYADGDIISIATGGETLTPQEIYTQNAESVVYIESLAMDGIGAGTGIILTEDGYIVTNAHVISGAMETMVTLWDETSYTATLVGWDSDEDLAVLKIDAQDLTPAVFGDSNDLQVGDTAYAIGNPLGAEYRSTFTDGIISALDRYLDIDGIYMSLIQTTTPINMGNSGGALLNSYGQVVGITTIKIMSSSDTVESMGFAIPSDRVVKVVNCLAQGVEILSPAMGVTVYAVTEPARGVYVQEVIADSYADLAGVLPGDIITYADGQAIYSTETLMQILSGFMVGDVLDITVYRDGETLDISIQLSDYNLVHGTE